MSEAFEGPMVRYNEVTHPTQVLVKHVEIEQDGSISKGRGGQIPVGCTVSTKTATLEIVCSRAFIGGTRQYILPANCELAKALHFGSGLSDLRRRGPHDRDDEIRRGGGLDLDHYPNSRSPREVAGPEALHKILS